ncbi:MAG: hypothetical protein EOO11_07030 [Chitinophagaceae bacterium]|nr:MAG: hypothetical protein EOO11_07030 [Chitinophagaceae bacterium]
MRTALKLTFLSACALLLTYGSAFCQDRQPPEPDDEFNLFLLVFGMCAIVGALVISALLALLVAGILLALSAAGALSVSALVGWQQRSLSAGFRTLVRTVFSLFGGFSGAVLMWLFTVYFDAGSRTLLLCLSGFAAGALAGLLFAGLCLRILRWSIRLAAKKLQERSAGHI